jgi:putative peptidoglycan lipid II flippase
LNSRFVKQSLLTATVVTVAGNVLGRILGFVREAYFASYFGTSGIFDTFIIAFTIPELIGMIMFSAMPMALIPLVKKSQNENDESQQFWSGLTWFAIGFGLLSALFYLLRFEIIHALAPNLPSAMLTLADELAGLLSIFIFFRGLEIYFRSWCFQKRHFLAPALSTIIVNLIIILSLVFMFERFHIKALAYGWILDGIILLLFNGYCAFKVVKPRFNFNFSSGWALALSRSLLAVVAIEFVSMSYSLVDRFFAGHYLGEGPISALRYASTLISIPSGVFVAAFNVASFPWIAEHLNENRIDDLKRLYTITIKNLLFFMVFAALGIIIFAGDIVRVALQRGAFDDVSLQLTVMPLVMYSMGIVFQAVYTFQMRFYMAASRYFRLGLILLVMLGLKILLSSTFIGALAHSGLALASSCAAVIGFTIMTVDLGRILKFNHMRELSSFMVKSLAVLTVVVVFWICLKFAWPSVESDSLTFLFLRLSVVAVAGTAVLFISGKIFGHKESGMIVEMAKSKLMR